MANRELRTALVTGAARGIGYAICERLMKDGHAVILVDRDAKMLSEARTALQAVGTAVAYPADISDEQAVSELMQKISATFGGVDILVNNAGISPKHAGVKANVCDTSIAEWNRVLAVNLTGAFLMSRACVPFMVMRHWGRIVSMSSQAGRVGVDIVGAHYATTKAGLIAFSWVLARELAAAGVTVNCVAPGRIRTPMVDDVDPNINARIARAIPIRRLGEPADVAAAVSYLVSEDAAYLTGATIDVNGGDYMG